MGSIVKKDKIAKPQDLDPVVKKKIGDRYLYIQESHKLPSYLVEFPFYDRALPRIATKLQEMDGYLSVVDIGANIGDTIALISEKIEGSFLAVEGDSKYLPLLERNIKSFKGGKFAIEESYVGKNQSGEKALRVYRENGTAHLEEVSSGAEGIVSVKELDTVIAEHTDFKKANLVKIDTDGFEISIIKSGKKFFNQTKPVLFFEFDPKFYSLHEKDPLYIFELLDSYGYKEALVYDNFGKPIKKINVTDKTEVDKLLTLIDNKNIYYFDILTFHESREENYKQLFDSELYSAIGLFDKLLDTASTELCQTREELDADKEKLQVTLSELSDISVRLEATNSQLTVASSELVAIHSSRGWRILNLAKRLVFFLLPYGSIRRRLVAIPFKILRKIYRAVRHLKTRVSEYVFFGEIILARLKPRKKRYINKDSKKIVYIGHSYHNVTKSTEFLTEYLKKFYDVTLILDESWKGEGDPYPDLSFIDESYLGVIFFQNLPSREAVSAVKNDNIIFFPMYDASSGLGYDFWRNWRDIKIMNFSSTLHKKLSRWGLESSYVQYFPKPEPFTPGKKDRSFFWQRLTFINVNTIVPLFGNTPIKLHIHRAVDPGQKFFEPTPGMEKKFDITYTDFFEKRADMIREIGHLVDDSAIYIAPREYEGIGMSFLENMAKGKAVIGVNNPTMNEYIINGETGYLFDYKNPKAIDLSSIEEVQKNTYKYMRDGYEKWQKDIHKIIEFLEK